MPKPTTSWLLPRQPAAPAVQKNPESLARTAGFRCIAGVDEAGRGPWAGPVVAAAVILRRARLPVRIDDSKRLTFAQRVRAFSCILDSADVGVGIVGADEIDRVRILRATHLAMEQAVADLSVTPDLVLIDGTTTPRLPMPSCPIVHGDQRSYVISCASIVAKVVRDRLMAFYHELDPRYAFHRHKGYGTARHAEALAAFGPSLFHRVSFRPVTEAGTSPKARSPTGMPHTAGVRRAEAQVREVVR